MTGSESKIHRFDQPTELQSPKLYEFGEHPHSIGFGYVLVVHSKTWVCLLKDEKDPSVIVKKEDVKRGLFKNLNFGKKTLSLLKIAQIGSSNNHTSTNQLLGKSLTPKQFRKDEVGSIWLPF